MNTQLFIKKGYTNLVLNPNFSTIGRQYWETVDENSNACGSFFDITSQGLSLGIPDGACQWAAGVLTVNQIFYPSGVTYLSRGTKYNVKIIIENLSQTDPLNPWYIKANLGGNDGPELSAEGYHEFEMSSGQGEDVKLIAFNFEDGNIGLDITYFEITEVLNYEIELFDTESIPLTFNISDIKDPSTRKSSFSKTIKVPGTKNNNKVFGHFFEIEGESRFNPAKKLDIYLLQDSFLIFDGILQLEKVIKLNEDKIDYEITLSGNLANIYKEWSDMKLNELDFSEYDHFWTRDNIVQNIDYGLIKKDGSNYQSWNIGSAESFLDTFYDVDGYLGLDFGVGNPGVVVGDTIWIEMTDINTNSQYNGWFKVLKRPVGQVVVNQMFGSSTTSETGTIKKISPKGEGYCYPRIHYGDLIGDVYKVTDLFPALYAKQIIDTAFNDAQFTYESEFFDSDLFRSLVIPNTYPNIPLLQSEINLRKFYVIKNSTQSQLYTNPSIKEVLGPIVFNDETTPPASDPNNLYNNTLGELTIPSTGEYIIRTNLNFDIRSIPDSVPVIQGTFTGKTVVRTRISYYKNSYLDANLIGFAEVSNDFLHDGTVITDPLGTTQSGSVSCTLQQIFTAGTVILQYIEWIIYKDFENVDVPDELYTNYEYFSNTVDLQPVNGQFYLDIKTGTHYDEFGITKTEGDEIILAQILPTDIKVADFFTSILKAFNLLVFPDPNNDRNLFIEPRDSFYTTDIVDWTKKLNTAQDLEILPLAAEAKKKYIYKYKDDGDFWNKNYQDSIGYNYGEYQFNNDTDFNTDENKLELIFSPTPLVGRRGNPVYNDNLILSRITKDLNSNVTTKSNLRLLYLGGQRIPINSTYFISSELSSTPVYPQHTLYAGHLDQPLVPTVDLNFWQPFWTYFQVNQWSTANLFNIYHRNQLLDTIDRDAKLVTGYFYLLPSDIKNLDFRKQFFVDGSYYRLNKITDYNGVTPGLTKVELIRFNSERPPFVPSTKPSNGGVDIDNPDTTGPTENRLPTIDVNGNQSSNAQQIVLDNSFGNIVDSGANKITFVNSNNNRIVGNTTNVVMINTDGLTIDEDNVTYIDGIKQSTLVSSSVQSVTGLDTDNTDPQNPIIQISVDGTTITGDGTPGNPLVSTGGSGGSTTFIGLTDVPASYTGAAKQVVRVNAAETDLEFFIPKGSVNLTIDGSGGVIQIGDAGCVTIPYNATITGWSIMADVAGSIVIDVWKDSYANYPPVVGDSIAGSEKPTLSSVIKNQDLTLTTWTTSVTAGDILRFNIDSATTVNKVYVTLFLDKLN